MSLRLLVYIQISEMFSSIADLYSFGTSAMSLCLIEAFQTQLFEISAMFWTLCLSIFIFSVVVFNLQQKWKLEIIFHVSMLAVYVTPIECSLAIEYLVSIITVHNKFIWTHKSIYLLD
jgi:hypothetical protein